MVLQNIFIHKKFNYTPNESEYKHFKATLEVLQALTPFIKAEFSQQFETGPYFESPESVSCLHSIFSWGPL